MTFLTTQTTLSGWGLLATKPSHGTAAPHAASPVLCPNGTLLPTNMAHLSRSPSIPLLPEQIPERSHSLFSPMFPLPWTSDIFGFSCLFGFFFSFRIWHLLWKIRGKTALREFCPRSSTSSIFSHNLCWSPFLLMVNLPQLMWFEFTESPNLTEDGGFRSVFLSPCCW